MTNLSDLLPSGGGAKEFTATADGAISQGQTVALQSDGTVKAVASSPSTLGTEGVIVNSLNPGGTYNDTINVTYCSGSDRYVVTYRDGDNGYYYTSRVCQANGTQLTVGSAYVIQSYGTNNDTIYYDSSADRVVHVSSSGSGITLRVGVVNASANSITWGTNNTLYSGSWKFRGSCFDTNVNRGFFVGNHPTNSYQYGFMVSVNAATNFASFAYTDTLTYNNANGDYGGDCTFDSNYNVVIYGYNLANSGPGMEAMPIRLISNSSGDSFTKGSTLAVVSGSGPYFTAVSIHYDATAQATIMLGEKSSGSNQGAYTWTIITNSTTSLSRDPNNDTGTELAGNSTSRYYYPYHITSDGKNGFIAMSRWQSNYGVYVEGSIQAGPTSPTWTTPTSGNLTGTKALYYGEVAYNTTDQRFLFVYNTDFADTDYRTFNYVTSNRDDFVGIASQAISNAASGIINPQGGIATTTAAASTTTFGSAAIFEQATSDSIRSTYDSNSNRVVLAYIDTDNSQKGTAVVGEVSGTNITWGTPVLFYDGIPGTLAITFDSSNNKVVISYTDSADSYKGKARVGTVDPSTNTLTFGSVTEYESSDSQMNSMVFDTTNNKVIIAYQDDADSDKGKAVVGTVSGTSISFPGSIAEFHTGSLSGLSTAYDSTNNRVVCFFRNNSNNNYGTGVVGQVSGDNISFGSASAFNASDSLFESQGGTFDSVNGNVVVAYRDLGASSYGTCVAGTVDPSTNTITFGTPAAFNSSTTQDLNSVFDPTANKLVVSYHLTSSGEIITASMSGTTFTFDSAAQFNASTAYYNPLTFDSTANKVVVAYRDSGNSQYGTAKVVSPVGSSEALTVDTTYYLAIDGSVSASSTGNTEIGKAVSTTKLLLKGAS